MFSTYQDTVWILQLVLMRLTRQQELSPVSQKSISTGTSPILGKSKGMTSVWTIQDMMWSCSLVMARRGTSSGTTPMLTPCWRTWCHGRGRVGRQGFVSLSHRIKGDSLWKIAKTRRKDRNGHLLIFMEITVGDSSSLMETK